MFYFYSIRDLKDDPLCGQLVLDGISDTVEGMNEQTVKRAVLVLRIDRNLWEMKSVYNVVVVQTDTDVVYEDISK